MLALDAPLLLSLAWIVACAVLFFALLLRPGGSLPGIRWVITAALAARLVPALILPVGAGYDIAMFEQAARAMLEGQNLYYTPISHAYLPLQIYWMMLSLRLAEHSPLAFAFSVKLPSILADMAIVPLLYMALRDRIGIAPALRGAWLAALSPITILICAYHGQFDAQAMLLLLGAWYVFTTRRWGFANLAASALLLGLGILDKTWPAILLPMVLLRLPAWRQRLGYAAAVLAMPACGLLFYEWLHPGSVQVILQRVSLVGGVSGWWGYAAIANVLHQLIGRGDVALSLLYSAGKLTGMAAAFIVVLLTRHRSMTFSLSLTFLTFLTFMPNIATQRLGWIVPIAILCRSEDELGWYTAGAFVHMTLIYWGMHLVDSLYHGLLPAATADMLLQLSSLPAWLAAAAWWGQEAVGWPRLPRLAALFFRASSPGATQARGAV